MNNYMKQPIAIAYIKGGPLAPQIIGTVIFKDVPNGTEVYVYIQGLPKYQPAQPGQSPIGPHGFHIHEFGNCTIGNPNEPFGSTGGHWNPDNQPHGSVDSLDSLVNNNTMITTDYINNKNGQAYGKYA